jgi:hypothetical protein
LKGGEDMEKQEVTKAFTEMTKKLIQQVMDERDVRNISPELLREIRSNFWDIAMLQDRTEKKCSAEERTYAVFGGGGR